MDSSDNRTQSEPESAAEETQEGDEKHEGVSKKPWRAKKHSKTLYENVKNQIEFYFSSSNLSKDRFMSKLLQDDPFVPLSTFMNFNKIKQILNGGTEKIIRKALLRSTVLELSEDETKVRRKENAPVKSQEEIDECTIYVEQIPLNSTHDSIKEIFSRFGKVSYVSLPRYKNSRQIKQFGFVEFEEQDSIMKAINSFKKFDGVLLFQSLKAENLLSIATHDKEPKEEAEKDDDGQPPAKKPRVEEENPPETDEGICEDKKEESEDEAEDEEESTKQEDPEDPEEPPKKKKKNRKHKKKTNSKNFFDERIMAMKIMRKKEWKKMRNAYLNLERQKAKEIKKILRESYNKRNNNKILEVQKFSPATTASPRINFYGSPNDREDAAEPVGEAHSDANTSSGVTFTPGVIVNIKFREQCLDFKELKKEFKQYAFVCYVDILESGAQCYIRVDTPNSAQELVSQYSSCEYETEVLKDEAEKEYWRKIFEKRDAKRVKESPKKEKPVVKRRRGREKLLEKISKAAQHIRFEEVEEVVE